MGKCQDSLEIPVGQLFRLLEGELQDHETFIESLCWLDSRVRFDVQSRLAVSAIRSIVVQPLVADRGARYDDLPIRSVFPKGVAGISWVHIDGRPDIGFAGIRFAHGSPRFVFYDLLSAALILVPSSESLGRLSFSRRRGDGSVEELRVVCAAG